MEIAAYSTGRQKAKIKASPQCDEAATKNKNLCTTEALSHGEKQKINGFVPDRWDFAVSKTRVSIFRTCIRVSENRGHGNVATHGSIAVPCTPFSDGAVKSKYRDPGFGHIEIPSVRHEPIYLLFFSVTLWL